MKRRLYFLFPDTVTAQRAVADLTANGVDTRQIHTVARDRVDVSGLPPATVAQRRDVLCRIERGLWNCNLALFALAVVMLVAGWALGNTLAAVLGLVIMLLTFSGGALFALRVPSVHLDEFRAALAHGEILLMVDVSRDCVESIEELMLRVHPEAVPGGSSWTPGAMGI